MRILGILLCLTALGLAGYSAFTFKAPKIQADIEKRMTRALSVLGADDVEVLVDGRHVTLEGRVVDDQQRQDVLRVATALPGVIGPVDAFERLALASPYSFDAVKDENGKVVVEGHAPTAEGKASIEDDAKALFGDDARIEVELADGAPSEDWQAAVTTGLDALATMRQGRLSISDEHVVLDGDVGALADVDAIDIFAQSMPPGYRWTDEIDVLRQTAEPFTFSVVKGADGSLQLSGYAPDEATRTALIEEGKAVGGDQQVVADIQIADGMPDEEWPSLVQAGISAMNDMEAGRFDVVDNDVSFTGDPRTNADEAKPDQPSVAADVSTETAETTEVTETAEPTETAETAEVTETAEVMETAEPTEAPETAEPAEVTETAEVTEVTEPAETAEEPLADADTSVDAALVPAAEEPELSPLTLTVDKAETGTWSIRGVVPDEDARNALVSAVQNYAGVDTIDAELDLSGGSPNEDWIRFVNERIPSLDVVSAGRLHLEEDRAHFIGVVDTQEDVEPVETVLAAIDQAMTVDLQPIDPRPIASLDLKLSAEEGLVLKGALPEGVTEGEALSALGIERYDGALSVNGRGSVEPWRQNLAAIGDVLPIFDEVDVSLGGDRPTIKGRVNADSDADTIARKIILAFSTDRQPLVDLKTSTTSPDDGARRINPFNGGEDVYQQGYWLPVIEIAAGVEACDQRSSDLLATDKISFLRGEDNLDEDAEGVLNALAGLAIACLDHAGLVLEIGGHTDARGAVGMNRELSQARADAVLEALSVRGVDPKALLAVGYGHEQPIADNATTEGRAANRRITFEWKTSATTESSEVEG